MYIYSRTTTLPFAPMDETAFDSHLSTGVAGYEVEEEGGKLLRGTAKFTWGDDPFRVCAFLPHRGFRAGASVHGMLTHIP